MAPLTDRGIDPLSCTSRGVIDIDGVDVPVNYGDEGKDGRLGGGCCVLLGPFRKL